MDQILRRAMLRELELERLEKTHPYDLSGGEQQRLALGKLLLLKPKLLLLDEPTKGLDPFFKQTLAALFKRLTGEGVTILMVSHDLEFCARHADRCALMFDGEIVSVGNGNPKGYDSFKDVSSHPLHCGICVAVVRRTGAGRIVLTASAAGLKGASFELP